MSLGACSGDPATQTLVFLHAAPETAPSADELRVTVTSEGATVFGPRADPVDRGETRLAQIPLVPKDDDATRSFEVHAELLSAGEPVAEVRVQAGYVRGELRELHVWFDPACEGVLDCGEGRTCSDGRCVASCYDPEPAAAFEGATIARSHPRCGECARCTSVRCEALGDGAACGCPGDSCAGGRCRPARPVTDVDIARGHGCAVADGDVFCWGATHGSRIPADSDVPLQIDGQGGVRSVGVGDAATCLAQTEPGPNDYRTCFGYNAEGRLAIGSTDGVVSTPTRAPDDEPDWQDVEGGLNQFCALSRTREVYCWGSDGWSIGDPATRDPWTVPTLAIDEAGFSELDTDWQTTCAVHEDGRAVCFGLNDNYQAGRDDPNANAPGCVELASGECAPGFTDVGVFNSSSCGIREGRLECWGSRLDGDERFTEPTVIDARTDWTSVDVGGSFACALRGDGELYCFGTNDVGQLGVGDVLARDAPAPVVVTHEDRFQQVVLALSAACAIDELGALYCWGNDLAYIPTGGGGDRRPGLLARGPLPDTYADRPGRVCIP